MKASLIFFAVLVSLGVSTGNTPAQREVGDENIDSLSQSFLAMTRNLTTPEFERRKKVLRMFQRRGYVQVLSDVVAEDGVSALFSLLRVNAQIAYHLPHNQLVFKIPTTESPRSDTTNPWHFLTPKSQPYEVPLVQDWTFPADPWSNP